MIKSERLELFPTSVWCIDLPIETADHWEPVLLKAINDNLMQAVQPIHQQTYSTLHLLPELKKFIDWIKFSVDKELKGIGYQFDDLTLTGMWATRLSEGSYHPIHSHPNSWISGVYYPTEYSGKNGDIMFYDPRPAATVIQVDVSVLGENHLNSHTFAVKRQKGRLLFFPSWLWHSVHSIYGEDRYSISFDILPKGMLKSSGVDIRVNL